MEDTEKEDHVSLEEYDFRRIHPCSAIAIIGKRRSGKSNAGIYLVTSCLPRTRRYMAMCGNKESKAEWSRVFPVQCVFEKDIRALERLREYQDKKAEGGPIDSKYWVTVVLDDCGFDRTFMYAPVLVDVLANGRHYGIRILILVQYFVQLHPQNRSQLDYAAVLFCNNDTLTKRIHTEFVPQIPFQAFKTVLSVATENRGALWLDNTTHVQQGTDISNMSLLRVPLVQPIPMNLQTLRAVASRRRSTIRRDRGDKGKVVVDVVGDVGSSASSTNPVLSRKFVFFGNKLTVL
jgi:hypothetical protein